MAIAPIVMPVLLAMASPGTAEPAPPTTAPTTSTVSQPSVPACPDAAATGCTAAAAPSAPAETNPIVVTARKSDPADPAAAINEKSFEAVTAVDKAVVGPVAKAYEKGVPSPARKGLRNVLRNLTEPVNFVNFLLQGKPGKAFETVGRFAVNSTVGIGGLLDVAKTKPINLPYRANGFANTLGYYGVGPGPYMFLPIIGPTSARDLVGWVLDKSFLPGIAGRPFNRPAYALSTGTIKSLNDRVELDDEIKAFRASDDPYVAERDWYLAKRRNEIEALHGRGPLAERKPEAAPAN